MGGPINTKVASLIVHGKNILGLEELSDSFYGGLATALTSFRAVLRVNIHTVGSRRLLLLGLATHYRVS